MLVINLLGNLQLKIVSDLISKHAVLKIFPGEHAPRPPSIHTTNIQHSVCLPLGLTTLELLPPALRDIHFLLFYSIWTLRTTPIQLVSVLFIAALYIVPNLI